MDTHNLTVRQEKTAYLAAGIDPASLFSVYPVGLYCSICGGKIYFHTDWCRRKDCHDIVCDGASGDLSLHDGIWQILLWICLCVWCFWRCTACPVYKSMQKTEKETGEDSGKNSRDFKLYEIFGTVADCSFVLCWCIWKSTGNQPVGCIFHDPRRELPSGRIWDRSCDPAPSDGWHVCTGKILLPVLLPHGSSIFPASGTAVFLPSQNERKLQKRM